MRSRLKSNHNQEVRYVRVIGFSFLLCDLFPPCKAYIWLSFPMPRIFQLTENYIDEKMYLQFIFVSLVLL